MSNKFKDNSVSKKKFVLDMDVIEASSIDKQRISKKIDFITEKEAIAQIDIKPPSYMGQTKEDFLSGMCQRNNGESGIADIAIYIKDAVSILKEIRKLLQSNQKSTP